MAIKSKKLKITIIATLAITYATIKYRNQPAQDQTNQPQEILPVDLPTTSSLDNDQTVRAIRLRHATGDYGTALANARRALADKQTPPEVKQWIKNQLAGLLTSYGWLLLKQQNCSDAIDLFQDAEPLAEATKGLAYCYYRLGWLSKAEDSARRYLAKNPWGDLTFRELYLELLESADRYQEAAVFAETTAAHLPEPAAKDKWQQKKQLLQQRADAAHRQSVIKTDRFHLTFDSDHNALGEWAMQVLTSAFDDLIGRYNLREPTVVIEVLLYPRSVFNKVAVSPHWADGIYDGRLRIPVKDDWVGMKNLKSLQRILRHELTHALLSHMTAFRPLPPWFDEGLAQYTSCTEAACKRFVFPPSPPNFLAASTFLTPFIAMSQEQAEPAYMQSLYLMHALEAFGSTACLQDIATAITPYAAIDSDQLLRTCPSLGSFDSFVAAAKRKWDKRETW